MTLTQKQKEKYISWFDDKEYKKSITDLIAKKWEIKKNKLLINGVEVDELTRYGLQLLKAD